MTDPTTAGQETRWSEVREIRGECDCIAGKMGGAPNNCLPMCASRRVVAWERVRLRKCDCDNGTRLIDDMGPGTFRDCPRCSDSPEPGWVTVETQRMTRERYREIVRLSLQAPTPFASRDDYAAWETKFAEIDPDEHLMAAEIAGLPHE